MVNATIITPSGRVVKQIAEIKYQNIIKTKSKKINHKKDAPKGASCLLAWHVYLLDTMLRIYPATNPITAPS